MKQKSFVYDTGMGIPSEKMSFIFEEFRHASEGINREFEGLGLSLTLAKRMIEIMNGKIEVDSIEGKGSTFALFLPIR